MKTYFGIFLTVLSFSAIVPLQAATTAADQSKQAPAPMPYGVTTRDANSQVWERTVYELDPSGQAIPKKHSYTELSTGLNYQKNGQWVASKEWIDILPNGTAAATQGQHQAYFPGDIYQGQIELVTPNGQHLKSRPLGLSYFDGENTVLIAELTNSIGVVAGSNVVIYPNAFTDIKADLRYTYTKAGFEQDIILRQQPPTPESFGLNPDNARLQVMTEFFSPPQPSVRSSQLPAQAGLSLADESLGFGAMQMIPGRAFLLGQDSKDAGALVSKRWAQASGRQFLVEEVPVDAIVEGLAKLPLTAMRTGSGKIPRTASKHLSLPPQRLASDGHISKAMLIAKAEPPTQGFVLDYQTVNSSQSNFTFQGDSTYYISGSFSSYGTNTFEGGAVIKYAANGTIHINPGPPGLTAGINWKGAAYRPVIFTAKDDNSVGESISGSTGSPTGYYGNPMLFLAGFSPASTFTNIRMAFAKTAITFGGASANFYGAQFIGCQAGIGGGGATVNFRNALFANVTSNFTSSGSVTINAQNVTFSGSPCLWPSPANNPGNFFTLTNCILVNVTNVTTGYLTASGSFNGFYNAPEFGSNPFTNTFYPFQSVGAGNYYLTNGCNFFNAGTTNLNPTLLANLGRETTYPPIVYSNTTISVNTTLSPQAQLDTDTPDLGYHYDPVDYFVDYFQISNATLTITNGAVVAADNTSAGIWLQDGSSITSIGSPLHPNWIIRYSCVQEQPLALGGTPDSAISINPYHMSAVGPTGTYRFTKFACPAGIGIHLYHNQNYWNYSNLKIQDCEFWAGSINFGGYSNTVTVLNNNLFVRFTFAASNGAGSYLYVTNNLFWGNSSVNFVPGGSAGWYALNNVFDSCGTVSARAIGLLNSDYNAYLNSSGQLNPTNSTDIFLTNSMSYQSGPLGDFYQPTNSVLINRGSTTADQLGLYHFTTQTNQVKEASSTVDIGYHYVAVDGSGNPIDTDGDGTPDYLEDSNGNGVFDTGDLGNWLISPFNGLNFANGLQVFTPLK